MPPLSVLKQGIRGSNSTIVRGNDQNESCETGGACRTYQFNLGTSLAVLTPIEQSENLTPCVFSSTARKTHVTICYLVFIETNEQRELGSLMTEYQ